jgi:hypothetical protein
MDRSTKTIARCFMIHLVCMYRVYRCVGACISETVCVFFFSPIPCSKSIISQGPLSYIIREFYKNANERVSFQVETLVVELSAYMVA